MSKRIKGLVAGLAVLAVSVFGVSALTTQPAGATNNNNQNNNNQQYRELPNAGPGEIIAVVMGTAVVATVTYEVILSRKMRGAAKGV